MTSNDPIYVETREEAVAAYLRDGAKSNVVWRPTGELQCYSILYSYPTWDPYYRGQRGEVIEARNEQDAIERIRRGEGRYGKCPDAQIVRCKVKGSSERAR